MLKTEEGADFMKRIYYKALIFLLVVGLLSPSFMFGLPLAQASFRNEQRKVVLLIADRVSLSDLLEGKNLKKLAEEGCVGLLNTRTAKLIIPSSTYLTIGCGTYADGGAYGNEAFSSQEIVDRLTGLTAGEIFKHRTGIVPTDKSVVNLGIADIIKRNADLPSSIAPGLLGKALKQSGLKVAVLGNADLSGNKVHREVVLIAMDEEGMVSGDVSSALNLKDTSFPGGYRTDYETLLIKVGEFLKEADFLVIETGDTSRVDSQADLTSEAVLSAEKTEAINRLDEFVGLLLKKLDLEKTLVMVVSPTPSRTMLKEKARLTPLIISGLDFKEGVLSSETTRRNGIVTNLDIAPTVLSFLGANIPYQMSGRPIFAVSQKDAIPYLLSLNVRATAIYQVRNPVLATFVVFVVASILLSLFAFFLKRRGKTFKKSLLSRILLLWALSFPFAFLFQPPFVAASPWGAALFSFVIALAFAGTVFLMSKEATLSPIIVITMITSLALLGDTLFGSKLMLQSFFGSCPIAGGRFYGLGNTYMGAVVGASIVGITALTNKLPKDRKLALVVVALFLLAVCIIVGYPQLGANVGGLITCVGASIITLLRLREGKIKRNHLLCAAIAVFSFLALVIFVDLFIGAGKSHLGRAVELIRMEGVKGVSDIISRKLTMNLRGIKSMHWGEILAVIILFLPLVLMRLKQAKKIPSDLSWFYQGLVGASAGAIFALIFNDTGIVAGGIIVIYVLAPLLYVLISEEKA